MTPNPTRLSTGQPSTLGSYRDNCIAMFGEDSAPAKFFIEKIANSPNGELEEVIAEETQVMGLIAELLSNDAAE